MRKKTSIVLTLALLLSGIIPLMSSPAFGATVSIQQFAGGANHSLALDSTGHVWAWGDNYFGQLGNGTNISESTPILLESIDNVTAIASGRSHSLALKSDGTVWSWGSNSQGRLGIGTTDNSNTPVQVQNIMDINSITSFAGSSFAIKNDGTLWAWGNNDYGKLGTGDTTEKTTPVQVTTLNNVIAIAQGEHHTVAITSDGSVWAWGYNEYGQLGIGNTEDQLTPVQVTSLNNVSSISTKSYSSFATKSDGSLWAWGYNEYGRLGIGNTTNQLTPVQVTSLDNVSSICCTSDSSFATKTDGSLWAWGSNGFGELGIGNTITPQITPVQVTSLTNVTVFTGICHSFAIKPDGTLWAWGRNDNDELGDGSTTNQATPIQILFPEVASPVLDIVSSVDSVNVGEIFTVDIALKNVTNICAEDVSITYDTNVFEYLGTEDIEGIKIYHEEEDPTGTLRYITASLGESYAITGEGTLLKLKFKGIGTGDGTIDAISGRIADNGQIEVDIESVDCGEKTFTVSGYADVNRTGTFTLLDLAIDAWYYGSLATDTDTTKYDADVIIDNSIDNLDLTKIVEQILANAEYAPNN